MVLRFCVMCFTTLPIMWALWDHGHDISAILNEPSRDGRFLVAVAVAGFVVACSVALLTFALEALPWAPFRHIDVDASGVTMRHWLVVRRILHRDIDGWGVSERELRTRTAEWPPVRWRVYSAVAGRGVSGGQRVHPARTFAMTVSATAYTPLTGNNEQFASLLAGFLSDCRGARGKRAVVDVPEPLASQTFALNPDAPRAPRTSNPKRPQSPVPGRYPSNKDMAAYWNAEAFQAMRAADDLPAFDRAATMAETYTQLARRDRKRLARQRREAKLNERRELASNPRTSGEKK
ncbi:MAG: hypothetical protein K8S25_15035 [Alphaproteobacteria bacterium]|nr:hypothetical protein [Alphaproteobacteria bacterium]